jgi:hypothetical protein
MVGRIIEKRQGNFVKSLGDGLLSYFPTQENTKNGRAEAVLSAVKAAIDMKLVDSRLNSRGLSGRDTPPFPEINLRIAINSGVIRIGPIIGEVEDIIGSHVNLTSRMAGLISKRPREKFETEPIILSDMAAVLVDERVSLVSMQLHVDDIKGFGDFSFGLVEVINFKNNELMFSGHVRSKLEKAKKRDSFTGVNIEQPMYGPFKSREEPSEEIFVDYSFDIEEYSASKYVFLQLPLMATGAGRKGDSEEWGSIYFVNNGKEYLRIAEASGVVFNEPKPFEYAPCIDLKEMEKKDRFSLDWLRNGNLRIYMTLWNDGTDTFFIQPEYSRRWRRVYLGVAYI